MDDKIIVVTGAASGIGLATVQLLLAQKAKVFGIDRSPRPDALQSQSDSHFAFHQVDIAESSAPAFSIAKCVEVFGPRIDGLLNVAGVIDGLQGADTITDGMWDRVIAVNLTAPVRLMREVIKFMKTQGSGAIVNVSSKAGLGGGAAGVAYTSSKHGLIGATKATAVRFRNEGIRCNAIAPGVVATGLGASVARGDYDHAGFACINETIKPHYDIMSGKPEPGETGKIAKLLAFLVSDAAEAINGSIIPIDQAWSAF